MSPASYRAAPPRVVVRPTYVSAAGARKLRCRELRPVGTGAGRRRRGRRRRAPDASRRGLPASALPPRPARSRPAGRSCAWPYAAKSPGLQAPPASASMRLLGVGERRRAAPVVSGRRASPSGGGVGRRPRRRRRHLAGVDAALRLRRPCRAPPQGVLEGDLVAEGHQHLAQQRERRRRRGLHVDRLDVEQAAADAAGSAGCRTRTSESPRLQEVDLARRPSSSDSKLFCTCDGPLICIDRGSCSTRILP